MATKLILNDDSIEFIREGATLRSLIEQYTKKSLNGSTSFLDDVEVPALSGRQIALREIRSVEW